MADNLKSNLSADDGCTTTWGPPLWADVFKHVCNLAHVEHDGPHECKCGARHDGTSARNGPTSPSSDRPEPVVIGEARQPDFSAPNHDVCAEMFAAEYKLADLLAGEIRHVLEEGCVDACWRCHRQPEPGEHIQVDWIAQTVLCEQCVNEDHAGLAKALAEASKRWWDEHGPNGGNDSG